MKFRSDVSAGFAETSLKEMLGVKFRSGGERCVEAAMRALANIRGYGNGYQSAM
jgi:hypothetical protein